MAYGSKGSVALTVKLRAMYGKRLTQQNYRDLLHKQSVPEIAAYLKQQTSYGGILHDINENSVHRGQLESVIRRQVTVEYGRMRHFIGEKEKTFYDFFPLRMIIDEILSCIRSLNAGLRGEYILSLPSEYAKYAEFDLFGLARVKTYEDLLNLLYGTPYYDVLKKFDPNDADKLDNTRVENEFNKFYYTRLFGVIDKQFDPKTRDQIKNSFGMQIDLENIALVFRLKKYFNVENDYAKALLLPFYTKINQNDLLRIIEAADADQAMAAIRQTYYGKYFTQGDFDYIDKYAQQILYDFNKKRLAFTISSSVAVVAYLQLKRTEINNIISIIEGVRYRLSPSEIERILTGTES